MCSVCGESVGNDLSELLGVYYNWSTMYILLGRVIHIDIIKYEVCQIVRVHVSQWFPVTVSLLEVTQHSSIRCMHHWSEEGEDKHEGG